MPLKPDRVPLRVRLAKAEDDSEIIALSSEVYRNSPSWTSAQLESHRTVFPDGQFVVVRGDTKAVIGMSASLIVLWDDYQLDTAWRDFTDGGTFTNHDPEGHTLYGAEIMIHPAFQSKGAGTLLYSARSDLAQRLGLWRIRAGARLRDYHKYADKMSAEAYTAAVVRGDLVDRTLTFQLRRGYSVLGVVSDYLRHDPESLGHAAVIEWKNPQAIR
ncbi:MAG: GNAT family N-acetyltransferase [Gemmatimonadaceae bacterium]